MEILKAPCVGEFKCYFGSSAQRVYQWRRHGEVWSPGISVASSKNKIIGNVAYLKVNKIAATGELGFLTPENM